MFCFNKKYIIFFNLLFFLGIFIIFLIFSKPSYAVRPFVTDDARIVDKGQLEIETWSDFNINSMESIISQNIMVGITFTDYLEIIVGRGLGSNTKNIELSFSNPVIQPKFLIFNAKEDGFPGLAFSSGITLPFGNGSLYNDATGYYLMSILTSRLFNDFMFIHLNLGFSFENHDSKLSSKPYWGIGTDIAIFDPKIRFISEIYAGDPLETINSIFAVQTGFRYLKSDYLNFDITFGFQPESKNFDKFEYWLQIGIRLLFDIFTDNGNPGNPNGAKGLF